MRAEDQDAPGGHVFAAVIADALNDGVGAAVADGKAFAGDAPDVGLAARRAVERDVADDDVLFRREAGHARRINDQPGAGQAFADEVVRVAFERQRDAARHESAEALSGRSGELQANRVVGKPLARRDGA